MVFWTKENSTRSDVMTSCDDDIIEHPIDGTLDLHTFRPEDIHSLIPEYLNECVQKGIREVRIVHGKGSGRLRKGVQDLLKKLPEVKKFQSASPDQGGWGATIVWL